MIRLEVSYTHPHKHFIDFALHIPTNGADILPLQLPVWRPGRYELQNYARYIQRIEAVSDTGKALTLRRTARHTWHVPTKGAEKVILRYNYFAKQLDAGGSWLDENLFYVNWINCVFFIQERINEPYEVLLHLPEDYRIACALPIRTGNRLCAADFYELADSPLLASANLQHCSYRVTGCEARFHLWFYGNCLPDRERLIADFQKFTRAQIELFGEFPASDYHFLFIIAPWQVYHGVEHQCSTIIVLGPDADFGEQYFYDNLLGIASHELFHFWNVCRIRPRELMPYDLTREIYFPTGFVAEGVTTFYGDYMLYKSGIWSFNRYLEEVNAQLKKYTDNFGRKNMSLAEASYDLWTDGYTAGIPHRKVSIYNEGALAALLLHLQLLKCTNGKRSLDDVMRLLWQRHGITGIGYTMEDYKKIVNETAEQPMDEYFDRYITGKDDLACAIIRLADQMNCCAETVYSPHTWERRFGMGLQKQASYLLVTHILPDSPADRVLSVKDKILSINDWDIQNWATIAQVIEHSPSLKLTVCRDERIVQVFLEADGSNYFSRIRLRLLERANG